MSNVNEIKKPSPTSGEDQGDDLNPDDMSSLDRLAVFAKRIMRVPKEEIDRAQQAYKDARRGGTEAIGERTATK